VASSANHVSVFRQLAVDLLQAGADLGGHCRHIPRLEIQIVAGLKPVVLENSVSGKDLESYAVAASRERNRIVEIII
jgi:hypothetical protein